MLSRLVNCILGEGYWAKRSWYGSSWLELAIKEAGRFLPWSNTLRRVYLTSFFSFHHFGYLVIPNQSLLAFAWLSCLQVMWGCRWINTQETHGGKLTTIWILTNYNTYLDGFLLVLTSLHDHLVNDKVVTQGHIASLESTAKLVQTGNSSTKSVILNFWIGWIWFCIAWKVVPLEQVSWLPDYNIVRKIQ